ncbi:MAG TPA: large conductance mechanosensitive channel protein MscL [Propionicimonas sp.]|nr:large conductance mechanosensitive channel protein MscL [Propionicimonas sp.]HRA07500.1 large conductance mechanosensitive channel protein MscL [Propionicimonas sp.]
MKGFKEFLLRGNLIDLAIAFILGASFGQVVTAFTKIIMDIIGLLGGNPDFSTVSVGPINVGVFITAVVSFVIMAAVLYFGVVKPYESIKAIGKKNESADEVAAPTSEELLSEIRDLLKAQK